MIEKIEEALGFKLSPAQKVYIMCGKSVPALTGRYNGKTLALCIRACISKGDTLKISSNDRHYPLFISIHKKLKDAGINVRDVEVTEE